MEQRRPAVCVLNIQITLKLYLCGKKILEDNSIKDSALHYMEYKQINNPGLWFSKQ